VDVAATHIGLHECDIHIVWAGRRRIYKNLFTVQIDAEVVPVTEEMPEP
jgi:hypothetical protein